MKYGNHEDRKRKFRPPDCHCCGQELPLAVLVYFRRDGLAYCRRCWANETCLRITAARNQE